MVAGQRSPGKLPGSVQLQVQKGEVVRSRQGGADVERSKALAHEVGF